MADGRVTAFDAAVMVEAHDRSTWRRWLEANHSTSSGAWLVTWRSSSGRRGLDYAAAVEEALCFGWVDGQAGTVDDSRSKLYFAPRRPGSPWARSNKDRVERLERDGLMMSAGRAVIERAMADGSWSILDAADRLEVPPDLAAALDARPPARRHWDGFPPGARKALLSWIALAKRGDTRASRIDRTAAAAQRNERANEQRRER
jgi:uncharacterized protein YdeI (YjbR/CyaY-like superfamily)